MTTSVVVTGESTGIGWGIASVLVKKGFAVFGTVRKQADADRLQSEFGATFTPLLHTPLAEFRRQLEVNLIAPLLVTQAFAGLLGVDRTREGKPGRIVNISSGGGKMGPPFLGAYAASKHGLEGMSESLRRELLLYGIDVILIRPGSVNTPIWDKAEAEDLKTYRQTDYAASLDRFTKLFITEGRKGLSPLSIGEAVCTALAARKPKVSYDVVPQKFTNWTLPMRLPKRVLDRLVGQRLGLLPARK